MSEDKSKKPLLADLKKLRQRVADLEAREIKRVQAEEALKQSEEYSSTILNHSPNPILVANPDTSIRYVNPALEKLTGYSMVELVGQKAPYPWWTEEALAKLKRVFKEALTREVPAFEQLFKKKSGERFWVEITMTPIKTNGEFKYYLASWVDITERRRAEEALQLRAHLLNEATDSIIATDLNGNLLYMNEAACRTRGYSKEEMLNMNLRQLVPPELANTISDRLRRIQKEGAIVIESEHVRQDGSVFPVETTARTVNLGDRTIVLSVIRDITEQKKAEERIIHLNKVLAALRDVNQLITHETDRERLIHESCKIIVENRGYDLAWILLIDEHGKFAAVASAGFEPKAFTRLNKELKQGRYPPSINELLAKKKPFSVLGDASHQFKNLALANAFTDGYAFADKLEFGGRVYGVIMVKLRPDLALNKEEQDLFHELVGDMAYGLAGIDWEVERQKAEEILRESESKFSRAFHFNPHPMSLVTLKEGRYFDVNDSYVRTFGFSREELMGRTTVEMGIIKSSEVRTRMLQMLEKTREVKNLEIELYTKSGRKVHALFSADKIEIGGEACLLSVINDITERKQAEEALRESEERYRALLELGERIKEAVVMLQDDERGVGMHVYASEEWSRITGYSKDELLNMSLFDLVHPDARTEARERHERRLHGEVLPGPHEVTIIRKDGTNVPVEGTYAYSSYKGKPANVGYIRDISERKKMEEQLIVTDRLASIGELASGVAHELNNPLTGIIGFSELLLKKNIAEEIKEDLKIINREAQRTALVVRNLLTFARRHETSKEPVDINQAIQSVLDLRAYEQKVHNIEVVANFDPNLPKTTADLFRLQQVFVNIIINAEHFMTEAHGRGTLTITTESDGDVIRASFADDGPGIREENIRHLFDPFFTTKEVGKGTGLGLSICHGIVTEHGGQIYAESESKKGATFTLELPVK